MESSAPKEERPRERKRRETLHRIAEQGLKLFLTRGYEATTLDAIAEAAGISRRTFFYYFKSKEEILLAWQDGGFTETLRTAVLEQSTRQSPLNAVKSALLELTIRFQADYKQTRVIERLICANEALRIRHQAKYIEKEQAVFDALCQMWPQPKRQPALRIVAMISIGALRLAIDNWNRDQGKRPIAIYLKEAFADLKSEI
ncbi:TetR/AcrR family transcriptional regulator [Bradyrhizobium sp. sBnM-33]|uniref:TetR/AcrR family transcriptional regulator n=1 Tax=Bradyrhizobium sp. sBnM-33 TaxID=2831780 RepID=UPI001BCE72A7|nr:TetR/AcrR family transcriptional regulator [Bradyrhizobium sp. sBnM-33]WOH51139.1 helix-turn-helix domain-containing protein [Bradyrhizobium sp. sBnM-33]